MHLHRTHLLLMALGALVLGGTASAGTGPATWSKDVAPIVQERCQECHRPGQVGPMSLLTFEEARPWAASIKKQVALGKMPPWPADESSLPFHGAMRLTKAEIDTLVNWVDQGVKQGDPADLPAPREFKSFEGGWKLGNPDLVIQPEVPFTVGATVTDLYQCFQIPFDVDHELWLKGVEFQAGNSKVAHHFILFEDMGNILPALDAETPEPGCECADMDKIASARIVKMWAPGNIAPIAPPGVGERLNPGKNLILQAHYYNSTGTDQTDLSRVAFYFARPEETMDKQLRGHMVVQPMLKIAAGDPESKHEAALVAPKDMTYYSVGVHMHLRGKNIGQWAILPGATEEITMVWVPQYDFNWQYSYNMVEPFKAPKGTKFIMRSTHDNSTNNPLNPDPTKDVKWGMYSGDEMAFTGGSFTYDDEKLGVTPLALSAEDQARLDVRAKDRSTD